jgi:hypothetical protein
MAPSTATSPSRAGISPLVPAVAGGQGAGDAISSSNQFARSDQKSAGLGSGAILGIVLMGLGIAFLLQQILNVDVWHYTWPSLILVPGLLCYAGMILGGKETGRLAMPGSILTMLGLVLMYQNTFNQFQSWAYAWALIIPTSVGIGRFIEGWWTDRREWRERGLIQTRNGLVIFLVLTAFFELGLNLSGWFRGDLARFAFPALLILIGILLLFGRAISRHALSL